MSKQDNITWFFQASVSEIGAGCAVQADYAVDASLQTVREEYQFMI